MMRGHCRIQCRDVGALLRGAARISQRSDLYPTKKETITAIRMAAAARLSTTCVVESGLEAMGPPIHESSMYTTDMVCPTHASSDCHRQNTVHPLQQHWARKPPKHPARLKSDLKSALPSFCAFLRGGTVGRCAHERLLPGSYDYDTKVQGF